MTRAIVLRPWEVIPILAGRKTRISRIVRPQPHGDDCGGLEPEVREAIHKASPFGSPGDLVWCKEKLMESPGLGNRHMGIALYEEGGEKVVPRDARGKALQPDFLWVHPRPTISAARMPQWACRITLDLLEVIVHRVQQTSEAEAYEMAPPGLIGGGPDDGLCACPLQRGLRPAQCAFSAAWDAYHGPGAWERNDWVWTAKVRRVVAQ